MWVDPICGKKASEHPIFVDGTKVGTDGSHKVFHKTGGFSTDFGKLSTGCAFFDSWGIWVA